MPIVMPMAAENQMLAAVVRFVMLPVLSFRIIPAPRKPMPVTICAATLAGSFGSIMSDIIVKSIAPAMTKVCVLIPAFFPRDSRSMPTRKPAPRLSNNLKTNSPSVYSIDMTTTAFQGQHYLYFVIPLSNKRYIQENKAQPFLPSFINLPYLHRNDEHG